MDYYILHNNFNIVIFIFMCLLILILLLYLQYKSQNNIVEHYSPKINNPNYYSRPYISNDLSSKVLYNQSNVTPQYKTSHINYWYIPMQEYHNESMNLYNRSLPVQYSETIENSSNPTIRYETNTPNILSNYVTRGPISEFCFKKRMEETGDLKYSLAACDISIPQKTASDKIINESTRFLPKK